MSSILRAKSSSGPPLERFRVPLLLRADAPTFCGSFGLIALGISVSVPYLEKAKVLSPTLGSLAVRSRKPPIVNLLSERSKSTRDAPDSSIAMILLLLAEPVLPRYLVGVTRRPLSGPLVVPTASI